MSEVNDSKDGLPMVWRVQVSGYRSGAPWPVLTMEIREDGHIEVHGAVGRAYEALFRSCRKATVLLARQTMEETIRADFAAAKGGEDGPAVAEAMAGELPARAGNSEELGKE